MPKQKRLSGAAKAIAQVRRDPTRGEVFWFLYDEYGALVEELAGGRISWKTMLLEIQAMGLKNADGHVPDKEESIRKTFARVRVLKSKEAEARHQTTKPKPRPTNMPPPVAWQPVRPETRYYATARPDPAPEAKALKF